MWESNMGRTDESLDIRDRVFGEAFFLRMLDMYLEETRAEGSGLSEKEYNTARTSLSDLLSPKQYKCLREAEMISFDIAQWLAEFAFARGVYAGFKQHFVRGTSTDQFKALVFNSVLQEPGMLRYPEYCARRGQANDYFNRARECVTAEAADYIAEVELAWQNRFLGVCRYAFPLGYRFALSII